ncbi:putative cytochrome P450 oxidoreductase [Pseudomonas synxantha BG33R]|uniref:cytochrome P450 n=1 Tax=Pseudomonas synxantha TaxID=47883 RepID=UPI00025FE2F0|nr:cytochrome P450 [Pseudomonas synxantha]EIK68931.1 putative cytochrome P450 oxidoreductase [Pseudomonas synxantha BG33R]
MTPFEAATHVDPYVYYSCLRQQRELLFDADLGVWIASGAGVVQAILEHPDCLVRPLHEPIPAALGQGAAGHIFGRLMRMNEGAQHQCPRGVIEPILASMGTQNIAGLVAQVVETFDISGDNPNEWMFTLPVSVIATLIGFTSSQLQEVAQLTRDFVACLSPLSDEAQLGKAHCAAARLSQMLQALLNNDDKGSGVLGRLYSDYDASAWEDDDALIANLIGLLSQTCEATAGLIGNSLIALQRKPELFEGMQATPTLVAEWVAEVARHDSPVQNTRRFVARRCKIGDSVLEAGDTILLLLAAANRDPCANPDPDSFLLKRAQRRTFSFGSGRHQCPGQPLALAIASEVISAFLHRKPNASARDYRWRYLPSLNGRIPQFCRDEETQQ